MARRRGEPGPVLPPEAPSSPLGVYRAMAALPGLMAGNGRGTRRGLRFLGGTLLLCVLVAVVAG